MSNTQKIDYALTLSDTNTLKGIAICAMLWHHLFIGQPSFGTAASIIAQACNICVAMFLFLSGYGLTIQFAKDLNQKKEPRILATVKFLAKRYTKFYLNYWVIFAIVIPIGIIAFGRTFNVAYGPETDLPGFAILDFLGLMGKQSYNATWWFNRIILFFYFFFPFLYLGMRHIAFGIAILTLLYIWPHSILYHFEELDIAFPMYFYIFASGIFFARHKNVLSKILSNIKPHLVLTISVIGFTFSYTAWATGIIPCIQITTWDTTATEFLCLAIACIKTQFKKECKPLIFLGKHSMNMYLTHTFILGYFFSSFIYWFSNPILIFIVLLACSLLLSMGIEFCKGKLGFYKMQNWLIDRITNLHYGRD